MGAWREAFFIQISHFQHTFNELETPRRRRSDSEPWNIFIIVFVSFSAQQLSVIWVRVLCGWKKKKIGDNLNPGMRIWASHLIFAVFYVNRVGTIVVEVLLCAVFVVLRVWISNIFSSISDCENEFRWCHAVERESECMCVESVDEMKYL